MSLLTKRALAESLKKLMLEKPLNKITINDITEACGVNRMTFYYHFRDIYDLVEWICDEEARKALEGHSGEETWQQDLYRIFMAMRRDKSFVMNVYNSLSRERLERYLCRTTYDMVSELVEESSKDPEASDEDKEFLADFFKYAIVGFELEWIENDMREDPREVIDKLSCVICESIPGALDRLALRERRAN